MSGDDREARQGVRDLLEDIGYAPVDLGGLGHALAQELAQAIMRWEKVPAIPFFLDNTAAFVHDLNPDDFSTAGGARAFA